MAEKDALGTIYSLNPKVSIKNTQNGKMVYFGQKIVAINGMGATILELCENKYSKGQIIKKIENKYDAKGELITKDVIEFLSLMVKDKILSESQS